MHMYTFSVQKISLCLTVKHTGDFSKGKKCRNLGGTTDDACMSVLETIDHFTVVCLVTWPLNQSEAGVDIVKKFPAFLIC